MSIIDEQNELALHYDPFRNCETKCMHDTAPGALVSELLGGSDGEWNKENSPRLEMFFRPL